jgi:hypothetical protein
MSDVKDEDDVPIVMLGELRQVEAEVERLKAEVGRLRAERDALMALLVKEEVHHDAATGTYPPTGRWWVVDCDDAFGGDVFEDRDKAVASVWRDAHRAVRKAAGLNSDPKAEGVEPPG